MATVSTNIKIDSDLKLAAQELFKELGMNLSTAINVFLKQAVREQSMPFHIGDPFYSRSNLDYYGKLVSDVRAGKEPLTPHNLIEE